jgi:glutaredoxin
MQINRFFLLILTLVACQCFLIKKNLAENHFQRSPVQKISFNRQILKSDSNGFTPPSLKGVLPLIRSPIYTATEVFIVLALLSGIDGGFSGDWSKYGLIDKNVEEFVIQSSMINVGIFHLLCASAAGVTAKMKNNPILPAILRTSLIGFLSLVKVITQNEVDENGNTAIIAFPEREVVLESLSNLSSKETSLLASLNRGFAKFKQILATVSAGSYNEEEVNAFILETVKTNPCVMFSFTTCPYCIKAKKLLVNDLQAKVKVIELDLDRKVGYPIRAELGKLTGRTSVPSIWIGGQFIGGCNDGPENIPIYDITTKGGVMNLQKEKQLAEMLKSSGALSGNVVDEAFDWKGALTKAIDLLKKKE